MLNSLDTKPKKIVHPEFAKRMQLACDGNPNVPLPNHGRLGWFVTEFERRFGASVTIETVRKWFAGETIPRPKMMGYLAATLEVDHAWLSVGATSQITEKQKKVRNAAADGAVNVVAGLIQICGGSPAFPDDKDRRAAEDKIDLYAVIKGAQYSFHVCLGERAGNEYQFAIPTEAVRSALVIGLIRTGDLAFRFFEMEGELIAERGQRKGGFFIVTAPANPASTWKEITTFSERL